MKAVMVGGRKAFDRFTERARDVMRGAELEARTLNRPSIGPEHLLLSLLDLEEGVASAVLWDMGVDRDALRRSVETLAGREEREVTREIGLTEEARRVIELSAKEARRLGHHYIGTEDLLLGLIRGGDEVAARALADFGVTIETVRSGVDRFLAGRSRHAGIELVATRDVAALAEVARGVPLDRFTERALAALAFAQEEARRFNHNYLGTEHLLLGLVREGKGGGARAIVNLGASLQRVRRAVESIVGYGERPVSGGIGLTPRARRVLALARDEGRLLKRNSVGTEHLLLGMIREGEGVAGRVLKSLGVTLEPARFEAARVASFDGPSRPRMARSAAISGVPGTAGGERVLWEYLLLQTARDEGDGAVRVESVDGEADARFAGDTPIHEALRVLGDDGWELMSVDRAGEVEAPGLYAFKRPKL